MNHIQEAIDILKFLKQNENIEGKLWKVYDTAIHALNKQNVVSIDKKQGNVCPSCKSYIANEPVEDDFCYRCGQAITWGGLR